MDDHGVVTNVGHANLGNPGVGGPVMEFASDIRDQARAVEQFAHA